MKSHSKQKNAGSRQLKTLFCILFAGWTVIILGVIWGSYITISKDAIKLAKREAYKGYEKDVVFRAWASMHGKVYVPVTKDNPPNPYLSNLEERDITTPSHKKLTAMNPAYITRQVFDISNKQFGVIAHITSLNPIRKENGADKWETAALKEFEKGAKEYSGIDYINNKKYFRYMGPLITTEDCLQCHAAQGYKVGDVRGGISSSVLWESYQQSIINETLMFASSYGALWILGLIGLGLVRKRFLGYIAKRDENEEKMNELNEDLKESKKIIEENLSKKNILIEEISETKEKLQQLNGEKDKFFSIIAHDLVGPFQGFIGLTEIMAGDIKDFSKEELEDVSKAMNNNAKNLYKLISNLLEWSRVQRGAMSFNPALINLADIVNQNISLLHTRGEQKGIQILQEIPEEKIVIADESMLNTIVRNLLANAVKFTNRGGRIIIRAKEAGDNLIEVAVTDNGIGMPEDLKSRLFKIEEKVGRNGTENELSTGLGLLLCKEFIEKNGGSIWVESRENEGSTFYFTLPSAKISEVKPEAISA